MTSGPREGARHTDLMNAVRRGLRSSPRAKRSSERTPKNPPSRERSGSTNSHRTEHGTPKGRSGSRNYIIPRPQNLPSFLGDSLAPQAYQTLISLPIHMGTSTVALCKTDPVSWAQTPMPHHPVEAHFHNRFIRGLSAVYKRDENRPLFLAADQWTDGFLSL